MTFQCSRMVLNLKTFGLICLFKLLFVCFLKSLRHNFLFFPLRRNCVSNLLSDKQTTPLSPHYHNTEFKKRKISHRSKGGPLENYKINLHPLTGSKVCCWACGNVRYIDVSNEEHWAPLIHWGWEWAVKSYQASQRPTFSPEQRKWARYCRGSRKSS